MHFTLVPISKFFKVNSINYPNVSDITYETALSDTQIFFCKIAKTLGNHSTSLSSNTLDSNPMSLIFSFFVTPLEELVILLLLSYMASTAIPTLSLSVA